MYYEYHDFSKNDKKRLAALRGIGAQREIEHFMKKSLLTHQKIVLENHEDIRIPFWEYYETYKEFTKQLQRTYDNMRHRDYPTLIATLLVDKHLLASDVSDFSPEGREKLKAMENRIIEFRKM